ncbi:MAG TPA: ankyrin repeat domain-containing protein [Gemmatimonadales bacterium]|nr:ankyrin repeat domain-containing protein [Gemmatimonadales bacterium]
MNDAERLDRLFREAVSAIDAGDISTLQGLLAQHPRLVQERLKSPGAWLRAQIGEALDRFFKHPYLLWFLTEDAVRTGKLPGNVAAMARVIIEAARQNRVNDLQKQLDSTLHFTVCSPIGRDNGLQLELLDVLIDAGASTDGAPVQALICHNPAAAQHLLRRGAALTLPAAVCLELWPEVIRLGRNATGREKQIALALAALNGKANGLARLLPLGVDLNAFSTGFYTHATPLHHAVWSGSLDAVKVLVEAGANLATKDKAEHATPLGWAEYAQTLPERGEQGKQYGEIAAYLLAKGAPA